MQTVHRDEKADVKERRLHPWLSSNGGISLKISAATNQQICFDLIDPLICSRRSTALPARQLVEEVRPAAARATSNWAPSVDQLPTQCIILASSRWIWIARLHIHFTARASPSKTGTTSETWTQTLKHMNQNYWANIWVIRSCRARRSTPTWGIRLACLTDEDPTWHNQASTQATARRIRVRIGRLSRHLCKAQQVLPTWNVESSKIQLSLKIWRGFRRRGRAAQAPNKAWRLEWPTPRSRTVIKVK